MWRGVSRVQVLLFAICLGAAATNGGGDIILSLRQAKYESDLKRLILWGSIMPAQMCTCILPRWVSRLAAENEWKDHGAMCMHFLGHVKFQHRGKLCAFEPDVGSISDGTTSHSNA